MRGKIFILKRHIKRLIYDFILTKYSTPKKFLNLIRILFQHYIIRGKKVYGYPIKLVIDTTSYCNLKCPLCPTGRGDMSRTRGFMTFENFKKIIDEIYEWIFVVDFYNWGEPLLNKHIFSMIKYAHEKKIKTRISTNMTIMNRKIAEQIVESGLDELIASIDGASDKTYSKYRVGGNFEKVMKNLKMLIDTKKEMKSKTPKVIWQFIIFKHNENEIEDAIKIAEEIAVDEICFIPTRADMGKELAMKDEEKQKLFSNFFPSKKYSRYIDGRKLVKPKNCLFLWTQGVINWNGSVSGCCGIYPEKFDFGNVFEEGGFMKVWNNKKFQYARYIVKNKIVDESVFCSNCIKNGFLEP